MIVVLMVILYLYVIYAEIVDVSFFGFLFVFVVIENEDMFENVFEDIVVVFMLLFQMMVYLVFLLLFVFD